MAELTEREKATLFDKITGNTITQSTNNSKEAMEVISKIEPKKLSGIAKFLTLTVLLITLGFGIFGSFKVAGFDMDAYVKFLDKFIWPTSTLILSVGAGTITKRLTEKKEKDKQKQQ